MKVESGSNNLVIQSLTGAFAVKTLTSNASCEFDVIVGDSVVINIFQGERPVIEEAKTENISSEEPVNEEVKPDDIPSLLQNQAS